jgi:acylphosphatase
MKVRATVTIKGLVQGVAYRNNTVVQARNRGVNGWVMNLPNGDVQACFEGSEGDVSALVDWCRIGPSRARVDELVVVRETGSGEFTEFRIRY